MGRRTSILTVVAAAATLITGGTPASAAPKAPTGTFVGVARATEGGKTYYFRVRFEFLEARLGRVSARVTFPKSPCRGVAVLRSRTATSLVYRYHERGGREPQCSSGDRHVIRPLANGRVDWRATAARDRTAHAVLRRPTG